MTNRNQTTVGILYGGEIGAAVGASLLKRGVRVVTTTRDRSDATALRCREAGLESLDTLAEVVRQSNVILSLVSPSAAEEVATAYVDCSARAPLNAVYVDVNSIRPELAAAMSDRISATGVDFVDAAINGLAKNLTTSGTLFLSGSRANDIAQLFADGAVARVRVLGETVGAASSMKMLLGGLSKGMCALFAELAMLAQRRELLPEMLESCRQIYPGIMQVIDRMLPTYQQHSGRRAEEMRELEETTKSSNLDPWVVDAVRRFHEAMAETPWSPRAAMSVEAVIENLIVNDMLSPSKV